MESVFVVPMGGTGTGEGSDGVRASGCGLSRLLPGVGDSALAEVLRESYPDGACYAWGIREEPAGHRAAWEAMTPGDLVLGCSGRSIVSASYVLAKTDDPLLAARLWGDGGETFRLICFTDRPQVGEVPIVPQMFRYLDPECRGFGILLPEKVRNILSDYGSFEIFLQLCLRYGFPFNFRHTQD